MADIEMDDAYTLTLSEDEDICASILARFSNSTREDHRHLCAAIGAMTQELKDENLPLTPVAYLGFTCSSLDGLSSQAEPSAHVIDALLTLLSIVFRKVSPAILVKKSEFLLELLARVLRSSSLTVGAALSGLKCISHLLIIRCRVNWSDVSSVYGFLLSFITDSRPKVRRQSSLCLRDVLQNFQGTPLLSPASEGVTNLFERFLLLAGGSNADAGEGPKGAQEVLYVLDALKECLFHISIKYKTAVLKYYKTLLALQQPLVTKRITDSLNILCLNPSTDVSPEVLLDLLCSLALSVSTNETSVDGMTVTARLLGNGMAKIYSLNRQICIVKLPIVFNALRDVLASEHEEAIHAAVHTFKTLIHACIDESLIKQGVDQIVMNANLDARKSGPTIIEKVCATIESLLGYHYAGVWDLAVQVVSVMFDKLGVYSSYFMRGALKILEEMAKLSNEDFPFRKQLHECLGSALVAMGPETFLGLLPLNLEAEDPSQVNVWLFPILKQYTIGARLSFFTESILGMVQTMKDKSRELESQGRIFSSRSTDAFVHALWSLLPSFCNYASDTAESFNDLEQALCSALQDEPEIRGIICLSLQILVQQNKKIVGEVNDLSDSEVGSARHRAVANYTPQVTADNLSVLKSSACKLLLVLSGVFLNTTKDDAGCLQSTIGEFASIADTEAVSALFQSTMLKLLMVIKRARKAQSYRDCNSKRAQLFDLTVSLLPGLNADEINVLFGEIKSALQDDEGLIQKKAYKVLSIILRDCDRFLSSNSSKLKELPESSNSSKLKELPESSNSSKLKELPESSKSSKLDELVDIMIEVQPCHSSAKRHRLDCLYLLVAHVLKSDTKQRRDDIIRFLTEIVLALKEANKKTRNRAYDILIQIGHAYGDEEKGGKRDDLLEFFYMVAGGLAGETPHMISAAMKALARLAYEFSDLVSTASNLLPSTFLLLQRKNKEIIKANLGLLKVLVAKSQTEGLQLHLKSLVEGLLKWQDATKTHFKAKVKLLLEMLVRKCGLDAVKAVVPQEHIKLLNNIRKIKERKEWKLGSNSEEARSQVSKATASRLSRWNHKKVFSDFDDEETENSDTDYMDAKTVAGRRGKASSQLKSKASSLRRTNKNLLDQLEDEPLDLLDRQRTRSALRSFENLKRKMEWDDGPEIDSDGRLIIRDEAESYKKKPSEPDSDARSESGSYLSANSKKTQKRRKTSESGWATTGKEYGSKKAGGDLKRKDKLEPYAYWPLDRKMMSRRPEHRAAARKGISSVVKMTKRLEGKSVSSILSTKGLKFKNKSRVQKKGGSKRKSR
ncbi:PREDICTED: RRP12 [Prunus dulcis]|uniref:PREDICTED: RRP12 n=1 Tax=Prunus dulcis TaxID=3755 RepID=A0A5E4GKT7_PRUDU|nr:RRP12-like protein isoform X1 [Prunus dulcis]VVA40350.1 PREDICTED: RRP12 [Prunus dulcis]